jgi:hypothetical protein
VIPPKISIVITSEVAPDRADAEQARLLALMAISLGEIGSEATPVADQSPYLVPKVPPNHPIPAVRVRVTADLSKDFEPCPSTTSSD